MEEKKNLIITEINDGYIEPEIKDEDYIFGAGQIPDEILVEDGQWDNFLPTKDEIQIKNYDTFGCTVFNTTNQIETFERRIFGNEPNYSDRALYIMANIAPPGADPQTIYEIIRKQGLTKEEDLSWSDDLTTLSKYASPKPLPKTLLNKAMEWVDDIFFKHDYLPRNSIGQIESQTIKEALKRSSLAVAVYAWALDSEKYVRLGKDTHWSTIYGYVEGEYWKCYDSYPPFIKKLAWDFGFRTAKRIYIREKTEVEKPKESWWERWRRKLLKLSNA